MSKRHISAKSKEKIDAHICAACVSVQLCIRTFSFLEQKKKRKQKLQYTQFKYILACDVAAARKKVHGDRKNEEAIGYNVRDDRGSWVYV